MKKQAIIIVATIFSTITIYAQQTIELWPDGAPDAISCNEYTEHYVWTKTSDKPRTAAVSTPTITIYQPADSLNRHIAVVICPGGGYIRLSLEEEGDDVARKLSENGIAGIVLKYRLPSDKIMRNKAFGPLQDAQRAIRIVRNKANELNISKIGIMGFSAGGHLASQLLTLYNYPTYNSPSDTTSARPDFGALLYPVISTDTLIWHKFSFEMLTNLEPQLMQLFSTDKQVNTDTPPTFVVHCADDKSVPYQNSLLFVQQMIKYGNTTEYHILSHGGHGFGLGRNQQTQLWIDMFLKWLNTLDD